MKISDFIINPAWVHNKLMRFCEANQIPDVQCVSLLAMVQQIDEYNRCRLSGMLASDMQELEMRVSQNGHEFLASQVDFYCAPGKFFGEFRDQLTAIVEEARIIEAQAAQLAQLSHNGQMERLIREVEEELGSSAGAWDTVKPAELVAAVFKHFGPAVMVSSQESPRVGMRMR